MLPVSGTAWLLASLAVFFSCPIHGIVVRSGGLRGGHDESKVQVAASAHERKRCLAASLNPGETLCLIKNMCDHPITLENDDVHSPIPPHSTVHYEHRARELCDKAFVPEDALEYGAELNANIKKCFIAGVDARHVICIVNNTCDHEVEMWSFKDALEEGITRVEARACSDTYFPKEVLDKGYATITSRDEAFQKRQAECLAVGFNAKHTLCIVRNTCEDDIGHLLFDRSFEQGDSDFDDLEACTETYFPPEILKRGDEEITKPDEKSQELIAQHFAVWVENDNCMVRNMHDENIQTRLMSKPFLAHETVVFKLDVCHRGHFYPECFERGHNYLLEDHKATGDFNRECASITPADGGGCMVAYSDDSKCVRAGKSLACKKSCGPVTLKFDAGKTLFTDRSCFCTVGALDSEACIGGNPHKPEGFPSVPAVFAL